MPDVEAATVTPQAARLAAQHLDVAVRVARRQWPWDPDEAESIAMLALCEAASSFRGGRFVGWLAIAVRRRLIDAVRKETGHRNRHLQPQVLSLDGDVDDDFDQGEDDPRFEAIEDRDVVVRLLSRLQAAERGEPYRLVAA